MTDFHSSIKAATDKENFSNLVKFDYFMMQKTNHRVGMSLVNGSDVPYLNKMLMIMPNVPMLNIKLSELPENYTLFAQKSANGVLMSIRILGDPLVAPPSPSDEEPSPIPKQVEAIRFICSQAYNIFQDSRILHARIGNTTTSFCFCERRIQLEYKYLIGIHYDDLCRQMKFIVLL